jgi:Tol biopolymer transport system component
MKWFIRLTSGIFLLHLLLVWSLLTTAKSSSGGGVLAYTLIDEGYNPHVMVIDARSGIALEITPPEFEGRSPQWTPDGSRVTFPAIHNRRERHILETTLGNMQTRNLTEIWGYESVPVYSPVDSRIGFPQNPNTSNMPFFVVDDANHAAEPQMILPRIRRDVTWSLDGQYLAYIMIPEQAENEISTGNTNVVPQPELYTYHLSTGETLHWSENLPNLNVPVWSPDSTRIAITTVFTSGNLQIINLQTGEITPMPTPPSGAQSIVWSPDGRYLAYTAHERGDFEIFVTDTVTGDFRNITQSPSYDVSPTWSADGEYIAYISHRNRQDDIYILHLASGRIRRLTDTPENEAEVTWQPAHQ